MFARINKFLREVSQEMKNVSWPTLKDLKGSTTVVLVISLLFTVFTFLVDQGLARILSLVY